MPASPPAEVVGFLDLMEASPISGWVADFSQPVETAWVRVLIDRRVVEVLRCDRHRADARLLNLPRGRIGFF